MKLGEVQQLKIKLYQTNIWVEQLMNYSSFNFWHGQEFFLFSKAFRLALGPNQPPIQWVISALSF
jgi:hypothetical protein